MGTTTQHPRLLPLPQRTTRALPFCLYPDSADKTRLTATVRVTLKRTLTSTLGVHLRLEEDLFQDRFEVAHDFLWSLRA